MEQVAQTDDEVLNVNVNENRKGNVVVSWTGGKDGCFACYNALLDGFNVTHLLSFKDAKSRRSHEIKLELLAAQSELMGIPIIHRDFVSYEEEFKRQVRTLNQNGAGMKARYSGISACTSTWCSGSAVIWRSRRSCRSGTSIPGRS